MCGDAPRPDHARTPNILGAGGACQNADGYYILSNEAKYRGIVDVARAGSQYGPLHIGMAPNFPAQVMTRIISANKAQVEGVARRCYGTSTDCGTC